ncbi:glycosyltransferase [Bacillus gobiensis]|uniref:glycosyltransferase n=1 Tax=Bacillus gobiensis TaxID=1441095 RepID=UPI003D2200AD
MTKIFMVPNPTGTGHNMRMYSIACKLTENKDADVTIVLSSLQDTFTPLIENIGAQVINFNPERVVNYSKKSHLEEELTWQTMINQYFSDTFFNGSVILKYMSLFSENKPDVVVSDYNINASIAACMLNIKHVFVTERFNFTLVDVSNELLKKGGFRLNEAELDSARTSMNELFKWLGNNTELILTDKPYVEEMDRNSLIKTFFDEGKAHFVGPMIRSIEQKEDPSFFSSLGINEEAFPLITATVSGTTMFKENKKKLLDLYIDMFQKIKKDYPQAQMVLLARENLVVPEGILSLPYISNWIPLLKKSNVLLSHPGWITVTEISAMGIPAIFCLASFKEYHEAEAYLRLDKLGYQTHYGFDLDSLVEKVDSTINNKDLVISIYKNVYEDSNGASKASDYILSVALQENQKILN